jgi:hypothetical protein
MADNVDRVRKLTFEMIDNIPKAAGCDCQTKMKGGLF